MYHVVLGWMDAKILLVALINSISYRNGGQSLAVIANLVSTCKYKDSSLIYFAAPAGDSQFM